MIQKTIVNVDLIESEIKARGITVAEFCRDIYAKKGLVLNRQTLYQWKKGRNPNLSSIKKIADYFNLKVAYFLN